MVFDNEWFIQHQKKLKMLGNTKLGRHVLRIDGNRSSVKDNKVLAILPNSITWENKGKIVTEFRTHDKFGKLLYYQFYPLWRTYHEFDMWIANPFLPKLNLGFDTLTAYPLGGANSPCDGPVNMVGQDTSFATLVASSGNQGGLESTVSDVCAGINASSTSNQFSAIQRSGYNFDSSALTSGATISATALDICVNFKRNDLGSDSYSAVDFNPASTASIPNTDFANFGSTAYATVAYASVDAGGSTYTTWSLNAGGQGNVSKTGISSFGMRSEWDRSGTFGGVWSSNAESRIQAFYADNTGTSLDPKLTVTYTTGGGGTAFGSTMMLMGI